MQSCAIPEFTLSNHARDRIDSRGVSLESVEIALRWGRRSWSHGDRLVRLDRRCVARARRLGIRVDAHEGTMVVLSPDDVVVTAWRNRTPHRLRR